MTVHVPDSLTRARDASAYRGRYAPSPTGPLHAGSLLAALGSWVMARQAHGDWAIRIEDVDRLREVAGAAQGQLATLQAFGLQHDGPVLVQSTRDARYAAVIDDLLARGHAFVCHCSRADLAATNGRHLGVCRAGGTRIDPAIRLLVEPGTTVEFVDAIRGPQTQRVDVEVGDFVLRRADGFWAYQLAVVVDDGDQGITDVVRGADLLDSTARQILLQRMLGFPTPRYAHLPLLLDVDGRKLSKSAHAVPVDACDPMPALHAVWHALGQSKIDADAPSMFLERAIQDFEIARVPTHDIAIAASHNTAVTRGA
ncbi:tRNA glutamyl-Q(34) synthetase GluQRS [Luteimonas fraxinea]|uniref:Glutamyl-Q tRNA(Asp) synthetase n=1 Tax=Luteimonas fraxinea TaxID=2901869 RepID=A0ABS8UC20_9GAMM|nr:tRNA glutamyl-Q(34) synthetase GluQRS [Luteimonas fraxinea]MCD9096425.1 tRNA glutamyl-Q(34) synthetase GluQRS [Luteimonas fraxinea]UHH10202.1 tRNA glutamyl-Q(34) synthetase GluQRS [Luteimonas fraxinea]